MGNRRMLSRDIMSSDAFLDMPPSSRDLYVHLVLEADDEGFLNNARKVMRMIGASDDDARILLARHFLIAFDSGVVCIKHWYIHNTIRADRRKPTNYTEERNQLIIKENGAYSLADNQLATTCQPVDNQLTTNCQPVGNQFATSCLPNIREDKLSKDKLINNTTAKTAKRFSPPTLDDVKAYCNERKNGIDPEHFIAYYEARGWELRPGQKVKDWRACVRTWERNGYSSAPSGRAKTSVQRSDFNFNREEYERVNQERLERFLAQAGKE